MKNQNKDKETNKQPQGDGQDQHNSEGVLGIHPKAINRQEGTDNPVEENHTSYDDGREKSSNYGGGYSGGKGGSNRLGYDENQGQSFGGKHGNNGENHNANQGAAYRNTSTESRESDIQGEENYSDRSSYGEQLNTSSKDSEDSKNPSLRSGNNLSNNLSRGADNELTNKSAKSSKNNNIHNPNKDEA